MFQEVGKIARSTFLIPIVAHAVMGTASSDPDDIRNKEEMGKGSESVDEISFKAVEIGGTLTGTRDRDREKGDPLL